MLPVKGDKIICIDVKPYYKCFTQKTARALLTKGKVYTIHHVDKCIWFYPNLPMLSKSTIIADIIDDENFGIDTGVAFITLKKSRKLKLEKLNLNK